MFQSSALVQEVGIMSPTQVNLTTLKRRHAEAIQILTDALAARSSKQDCDKAVANLALDVINVLAPIEGMTPLDEYLLTNGAA